MINIFNCFVFLLVPIQESGAHREVHPRWNANPLQDFLRRQAFFQLYELDHKISAILDRTPWMEAEDFDLSKSTLHVIITR